MGKRENTTEHKKQGAHRQPQKKLTRPFELLRVPSHQSEIFADWGTGEELLQRTPSPMNLYFNKPSAATSTFMIDGEPKCEQRRRGGLAKSRTAYRPQRRPGPTYFHQPSTEAASRATRARSGSARGSAIFAQPLGGLRTRLLGWGMGSARPATLPTASASAAETTSCAPGTVAMVHQLTFAILEGYTPPRPSRLQQKLLFRRCEEPAASGPGGSAPCWEGWADSEPPSRRGGFHHVAGDATSRSGMRRGLLTCCGLVRGAVLSANADGIVRQYQNKGAAS